MIDRNQALLIRDVLETQYQDGITAINRVELDDNDNIVGIFEDRISSNVTKSYAFKITDDDISYKLMNPQEIADFLEEEQGITEVDFSEREARLEATAVELTRQAQKIAARQAELDRKEDLDFAEGLIKEGKALPVEKERLVTMMGALRKAEVTVEFSENDKPPALDALKDLLSKRPSIIAFGEVARPEEKPRHGSINFSAPEGHEVDLDALEIHEKALAYQEAHPGTSYLVAVGKVGG